MGGKKGYRGYVGSRAYFGNRAPQHVQSLVIRDYCQNRGLQFLIATHEFAMPDCFITLEQILNEQIDDIDGIVAYSIFMLPIDQDYRNDIYRRALDAGLSLHGAVENIAINQWEDVAAIEDIWLVQQSLPGCLLPDDALAGKIQG